MASLDDEGSAESPPAEERLKNDVVSSHEPLTDGGPSPIVNLRTTPNSPRRNGIPPKRPATATKRAAAATPSSATKSTSASMSRTNPGSGLSKPPTRPAATLVGRRPNASAATASATLLGHRPRQSTSSIEERKRSAVDSGEENNKPASSSPARKAAVVMPNSSQSSIVRPTSTRIDRRSTLNSSTSMDKKTLLTSANRATAGSPTKSILKSASTVKPTPAPSTPRNNHVGTNSRRVADRSNNLDPLKKRLSTIPASPATASPDSTTLANNHRSAQTPTKPVRPSLIARKSTMSITIEQRLREMELVNTMLQAAMTEDGAEDDEVKEEYGRKMDETLASLRIKLEEARRNEGKQTLNSESFKPGSETESGGHAVVVLEKSDYDISSKSIEELELALSGSQDEIKSLRTELEALQDKVLGLGNASEDVSKAVDEATGIIRRDHASEVERLHADHTGEVELLQNKLVETERAHMDHLKQSVKELEKALGTAAGQGLDDVTHSIEEQKAAQQHALRILEESLASEKESAFDAASRIEVLSSEVTTLQNRLEDETQNSKSIIKKIRLEMEEALHEKAQVVAMKDKDILGIQHELEELQLTHTRELEEVEYGTSQRTSTLESELAAIHEQLREHESSVAQLVPQHNEIVALKEQEIFNRGRIIESLQDDLQSLNQSKARELDAVKVTIIQEHERTVSTLRAEHELALQSTQDKHNETIRDLNLRHEHELQMVRREQAVAHGGLQTTIAELIASKTALQGIADSMEAEHATKLAHLQSTLAMVEGQAVEKQGSLEGALESATHEIAGLRKSLDALGQANSGKQDHHIEGLNQLKGELESVTKTLEQKDVAMNSLLEGHVAELQSLRDGHAKALEDLQQNYNALLDSWKEAQRAHPAALEAAQAEYEKLRKGASTDLEEMRSRLEVRHSQSRRDLEAQTAAKFVKVEKKHLRDLNDMQQQHEKSYHSLREELEKSNHDQSKAAQMEHNTVLAELHTRLEELQSQVVQHREALSGTETELQAVREQQAMTHRHSEHESQVEELQTQMRQAKAGATTLQKELDAMREQDKEIISNLITAAEGAAEDVAEAARLHEEMRQLRTEHEAEIANLQKHLGLENEKREKERKQGAEVRDRLTRELTEMDSLRKLLPVAKEEIEQYRHAAETARSEASQAKADCAEAIKVMIDTKSNHQMTALELEKLRAEAAKYKAKQSKHKATATEGSSYDQEMEALQLVADTEREQNDKLRHQLKEARISVDDQIARTRETEAALKVTTAELTEMKTKRANGSDFVPSPAPKGGLRTSRWAASTEDDDDRSGGSQAAASEDLGPVIEGTMASLREQVRQIEEVNEDMADDTARLVDMLSKVDLGSMRAEFLGMSSSPSRSPLGRVTNH